jgi:hypothetical protein
MKDEHDPIPLDVEDAEDSESVASNIERYLNNHTREGGHAWQMNMAARPEAWQPLELSPEPPPVADSSRA